MSEFDSESVELQFVIATDGAAVIAKAAEGCNMPCTVMSRQACVHAVQCLRECEADLRITHPSSTLADRVSWLADDLEAAIEKLDVAAAPPADGALPRHDPSSAKHSGHTPNLPPTPPCVEKG
jgi:hypothetical protein